MHWKKVIGFGLLLWAIMFALVSILIALNIYDSKDPGIMSWVVAVLGGIVSYILAGYLRPASRAAALGCGAVFVVVGLLLDKLVTTRFSPDILKEISLWFSYALILLAPLLRVRRRL